MTISRWRSGPVLIPGFCSSWCLHYGVWHDPGRRNPGVFGFGGHRYAQGDQRVVGAGGAGHGSGSVFGGSFCVLQPAQKHPQDLVLGSKRILSLA